MQRRVILLSIALLTLSSSIVIFSIDMVHAAGSTIHVDDDNIQGPWDGTFVHPFQLIQDGIDASTEGGTVYVYNGIYYENVIIEKTIKLLGENKSNTTIDSSGSGNVLSIFANHVNITGFTIKNGTNGITISGSSECVITTNTITETVYGLYVENLSQNNDIYNNLSFGVYILR